MGRSEELLGLTPRWDSLGRFGSLYQRLAIGLIVSVAYTRGMEPRLPGTLALNGLLVCTLALGACASHESAARKEHPASAGADSRVFWEPLLAIRAVGPPSREGEDSPPCIPATMSAGEVQQLLRRPMPSPESCPAGTTAREVIERVSGVRVVWLIGRESGNAGTPSVEHVLYADLYQWSVKDDRYITGSAIQGRSLGDLLGSWLDMTRLEREAFDRAVGDSTDVEFDPAMMITPVAIQVIPVPVQAHKE